jgi:hypothetical protein
VNEVAVAHWGLSRQKQTNKQTNKQNSLLNNPEERSSQMYSKKTLKME